MDERIKPSGSRSLHLEDLPPSESVGAPSIDDEHGIIMAIVAISALLLILLSIGWSIDVPTSQSATIKHTNALDVGAVYGLFGINTYDDMGNTVFDNSDAIMRNTYAPALSGFYSRGFGASTSRHSIWIPTTLGSNPHDPGDLANAFKIYRCTSGTPQSCVQNYVFGGGGEAAHLAAFADHVFDVNGIDDFRNAIMFYAIMRPYHYLAILPERAVETISVPRLVNTMTYLLIDPAFSLDPLTGENFQLVWGTTQGSDGTTAGNEYMFPTAALRTIPSGNTIRYPQQKAVSDDGAHTNSNANWGTSGYLDTLYANLFIREPRTGVEFSSLNPLAMSANEQRDIYKFYASMCDTLPFFHFKSAAVNLLDFLAQSSAFSPTTIVGLTGYSAVDPDTADIVDPTLIPIQPVQFNDGSLPYSWHPDPSTGFPLPLKASSGDVEAHNAYLHTPKSEAFHGYINSGNLDVTDTTGSPTGLNRPELALCGGLYGNTPPPSASEGVGYLLPEDISGIDDELTISHYAQEKRRRDIGSAVNWLDDSYNATGTDYDIDYSQRRDGNGTTARDIVGALAMRVGNPHLEWISPPDQLNDGATTAWRRPIDRSAGGAYAPNTYSTVGEGFRYLPNSIKAACAYVDAATAAYNTPDVANPYEKYRPVRRKAVIVYAFGLYSPEGLADRGTNHAGALNDLRVALKSCLCDNPEMTLILAFLPMSVTDRNQALDAWSTIQEFEVDYNNSCAGVDAITPCDSGRSSAVFTYLYDYNNNRFSEWDDGSPVGNVSIAKVRAAEAFNREVSKIIGKLLIEYVYAS